MSTRAEPDHSNVVMFPPLIPAAGMLVGVLSNKLTPTVHFPAIVRGVGAVIACVGVAGFAWMVITMKRARTPIHNGKTPTRLVETGPFRLTRNPMYLFGSTAYMGTALVAVLPWSLALLPVVLVAVHFGVVLREEAYLDRKFGDEYRAYKQRVPRWV